MRPAGPLLNTLSLVASVGIHGVIVALLLLGFQWSDRYAAVDAPVEAPPVIDAVSVDERLVEREMARLQALQQRQADQQAQRLKTLAAQAEQAERKRREAESELKAAQRARAQEQQRLAKLAQSQQAEAQHLSATAG